jgi:hypothetical protein
LIEQRRRMLLQAVVNSWMPLRVAVKMLQWKPVLTQLALQQQ